MKTVNFVYDNTIIVIDDEVMPIQTNQFCQRVDCERNFRLIHRYLLTNNIIKNNIIDLGAWVGDNSIPWAKMTKNIIYAIDPSKDNCDFIKNMCSMNNLYNISIINQAISDKPELLTTDNDINHCSFIWDNGNVGVEKKYEGVYKINATSLDELYNSKHIENIGYIHLDVEGMEHKILLGSTNLIDLFLPIISFEGHLNAEAAEINKNINYLKSKNYTIFIINDIIKSGQCWGDCRNFLAFPPNVDGYDIMNNINKEFNSNILQTI
jgi:FkbM family methyltransferase